MFAPREILAAIAGLGALAGCCYYALCLGSAFDFLRTMRRRRPSAFTPPVSILKPLKGADPGIYESFRSHCLQDYPEFEIIFGVGDPNDAAVEAVLRLQQEFPQRNIRLVVCPKVLGANRKVGSLIQMLPHARFDHLIVNDSDIKVEPDYLRRLMALFDDERVGMVTCLYRGIAGRSFGAQLESIGISTDFAAGVLSARLLEGMHFALGSTLAFSRSALEAIGGFEPLVDYLADDFELGARISAAGYDVCLSDVVVDHFLPDYSLRGFLQHQLRWSRGMRDCRRWGYMGLVFTFGVPWALLAVAFSWGALWSWGLLALAILLRLAMAAGVGCAVLHDRQLPRRAYLLPLRDLVALLVWLGSYAGHTVTWRGDLFVLEKGKLRPV